VGRGGEANFGRMENLNLIKQAYKIARAALSNCLTNQGIICGRHHFVDLWARDSLFATFGANVSGLSKHSKTTLSSFLDQQRDDGLIPYCLLRAPTTISKYLGRPVFFPKLKPSFRQRPLAGLVLDGGLLTVLATWEYVNRTQDFNFAQKHYSQLKKALTWYIGRSHNHLLRDWFLCEWADAVLKVGKTLYTNVLYWKALEDMSGLAKLLNNKADAEKFSRLSADVKEWVNREFWKENYFSDWIDYKRHHYFYSHGNMLACWSGLADSAQSKQILKFADKFCWHDFTLEENYPKYPWARIPFWNHLVGMGDYHNRGCLWLQPGILYSLVLKKYGQKKKSMVVLRAISNQIVKHQGVYEIYEKDGQPVSRRFYQAETPFAWSAGMFIYAYHKLIQEKN